MDEYQPAREAAQRWLQRSNSLEYRQRKNKRLEQRWQLASLRRIATRSGNDDAISLLKTLETEMLSHAKRVESSLDEKLV